MINSCPLVPRSSWGPPSSGGGRGAQLHRHQGDVALPVARETARADPRVPGALRPRGERRIPRPAPHQGRHASRCTGMLARLSMFRQTNGELTCSQLVIFCCSKSGLKSSHGHRNKRMKILL